MDMSTVLSPFVKLFQDRVFVTALLSAVGAFIVILIPALEPYIGQVIAVAVTLVILAAGGNVVMSAVNKISDARVQIAAAQAATAQAELARAQMAHTHG